MGVLLSLGLTSQAYSLELDCDYDFDNPKLELQRIKAAGGVVSRNQARELVVRLKKMRLVFKDEGTPSYEKPFKQYKYCDRRGGYILIEIHDNEFWYSSIMVNENTGAIIPADVWVRFSPNMKEYLAFGPRFGAKPSFTAVYKINGSLIWQDSNSTMNRLRHGDINAYISDVRWLSNGDIVANAACKEGDISWSVKLYRRKNKAFWHPHVYCPWWEPSYDQDR